MVTADTTGTLPVLTTAAPVVLPGPDALRSLVAAWLLAQRSEHTRTAYARDLGQWVTWLDAHGVDPLAARRGHVDAWVETLRSAGRAPAPSGTCRAARDRRSSPPPP